MKSVIVIALRIAVLSIALLSGLVASSSFTRENAVMGIVGLLIAFGLWQFTVVLASSQETRKASVAKSNKSLSRAALIALIAIASVSAIATTLISV